MDSKTKSSDTDVSVAAAVDADGVSVAAAVNDDKVIVDDTIDYVAITTHITPIHNAFHTIAAYDENKGIGLNNSIPWKFSEDMLRFKAITKNSVVIMGRKTYASIGKPLVGRINIVISTSMVEDKPNQNNTSTSLPNQNNTQLIFVNSPLAAYKYAASINKPKFVIGGSSIYKWFLDYGVISVEYITYIDYNFQCDTFYPSLGIKPSKNIPITNTSFKLLDGTIVNAVYFEKKHSNTDEYNFLSIGDHILDHGVSKNDRTLTGTKSFFGAQLTFDLSNNTFPLLTTRKMFLRGIFEELMLYIRGQTNSKILEEKKIFVWKGNTSREFLDKNNLQHLPVGDMGPSYGFLFRHFGGQYVNCNTNYTSVGYDQLANVIHLLKTNPTSRRIIISLWDPNVVDKCPLPPCLYNYQFYVNDKKLSCMMTQRSSDYAVAGGWNIATGALLTIMLARVCDLIPDTLIWNIGDLHLYNNVIENFTVQLMRIPYLFPKLYINKKDSIESYQFSDLELVNYQFHSSLDFPMNV